MKCTCGHPENYNYAIDNGLCNSCIADKLEQLEWIPVEERLPGKADYYNTVRCRVVRIAGMAYWNGKMWRKTPNHRYINKITHWKPIFLPETNLIDDKGV